MSKANKKMFSIRLPLDTAATIETYAQANACSKSDAVLHFLRLGMQADTGAAPATKADLLALGKALEAAIAERPIEIQPISLPSPETPQNPPEPDWRTKPLLDRLLKR